MAVLKILLTWKDCVWLQKLTLAHADTLQRVVSQHKGRFPEIFRFLRSVIFLSEYGFETIYMCNLAMIINKLYPDITYIKTENDMKVRS